MLAIDLSNNELNEREVSTIESSLANNMSLTSLDLRTNRLSRESDALDRIAMVVRKMNLMPESNENLSDLDGHSYKKTCFLSPKIARK